MGDRVSGEFFSVTGPRHSRAGVRRLCRQDGTMATEPEEMREIATQFYRILMTEEAPSDAGLESRHLVLSHVQRTVTDDMRAQLMAPFSICEIHDALRALARNSCPW